MCAPLVIGPTVVDPDNAFEPDQLPDAVQLVAFVVDQEIVDEPPMPTEAGDAEIEMVGTGFEATTITLFEAVPPRPAQERLYVYDPAASAPVDADPESAFAPDQLPEAVQLVAFVDDHARVEAEPALIDNGDAVKVSVGARGKTHDAPFHVKGAVQVLQVGGLFAPFPQLCGPRTPTNVVPTTDPKSAQPKTGPPHAYPENCPFTRFIFTPLPAQTETVSPESWIQPSQPPPEVFAERTRAQPVTAPFVQLICALQVPDGQPVRSEELKLTHPTFPLHA